MYVTREQLDGILEEPEDEHLEFKEAKTRFDFEVLVRYCAALANEGGGRMVLGVSDRKPRQVVGSEAFPDLERTKAGLVERLHLRIEAGPVEHPEGRVLVFTIPSRPLGVPIQYRGSYWMRAGESLVPMTQDRLKEIFAETAPDFSAEICPRATLEDLDSRAVERFREMWGNRSGNEALAAKSVEQLLEDAELVTDGGVTYAALILFGAHKALSRLLALAEVIFEYRSHEGSIHYQQRQAYREGFLLFDDKLWETIDLRNDLFSYQERFVRLNLRAFNKKAVREAILNAVSHRDYRMEGSIFVRQWPRKIEITSPGGFPSGVSPDNLLWKQNPRNRRIVESLERCGLIDRAGQGADLIFSTAVRESKLLPDFTHTDAYQVCMTLYGEVRDTPFVRFLNRVVEQEGVLDVDDLLVLDAVRRGLAIPERLVKRVAALCEREILERAEGQLVISNRIYDRTDSNGDFPLQPPIDQAAANHHRKKTVALAEQELGTCPFKGLLAFEEEDADRFFGRGEEVEHILGRLRRGERLLTLVGASGTGKSSLALAGLLPAVRRGALGDLNGGGPVTIVRTRPGLRPGHELALSLLQANGAAQHAERLGQLQELKQRFGKTVSTLSDFVDLEAPGPSLRLFLLVDQLEEVFTLADDAEREAFLANLLHAATVPGGRVTVVAALRADFLGPALDHSRELAEAVKASQEVVLPLGPEALREVIERPAAGVGLEFDDGLVDALVHEVTGQPGALPLLQFTLVALWKERSGRRLTWEAYRRIGELRGASARYADAFVGELGEEDVAAVRRIFGRLVQLGEGTADTRRRVPREEIDGLVPERSGPLVDRLIEERLLTAHEDDVEIGHEALIREWATLRVWVEADREALRVAQEVARASARWQSAGRQPEDLWRGRRLARTVEMTEGEELGLAELERSFVEASRKEERRERRVARILRWGFVGAVVLLVAVVVAAWMAWQKSQLAEQHLQEANLFVSYTRLGDAMLEQGDIESARSYYEQGLEVATTLAQAEPGSASARKMVLESHFVLLVLEVSAGEEKSVRRHLNEMIRILDEFERAGLFTEDARIQIIRSYIDELRPS